MYKKVTAVVNIIALTLTVDIITNEYLKKYWEPGIYTGQARLEFPW